MWNRFTNFATRRFLSASQKAWLDHPAGPKTVFFWAPAWKWALVFAGIGDYFRPAEKLSLNQSASLTATGFIWSRYSMVIIPKNYVLFSVNLALGLTGAMQVGRILHYQTTDEYKAKQAQQS
ncbi:Oidioi.mRNA.OKI2018_I69.chr2.g6760.t1.cds [Oikopleura dioica]|uniref:Mitochondrial pyruvate carrier n=1 Tax=Oikopleura dioica TaxID=34765 RepID=A0ABN7T4H4_OIKDI|nr:Oidioi.mRNA.OKI2018_I69.chr2.g6760.t1.cds [Oikopleura dioica]